ncbi:hypothetical protein N7540_008444 [Penicillium herquei]|nr:hypothetical protein N7540_008444 [Penicillium herquei]
MSAPFSVRLRKALNLLRARGSVSPNNTETPPVGPSPESRLARRVGRVKRWLHRASKRIAARSLFSISRRRGARSGSSIGANPFGSFPRSEGVNCLEIDGTEIVEIEGRGVVSDRSEAIDNFEASDQPHRPESIRCFKDIHRPGGPDRDLRPTESDSSDSSVSGGVPL